MSSVPYRKEKLSKVKAVKDHGKCQTELATSFSRIIHLNISLESQDLMALIQVSRFGCLKKRFWGIMAAF